MRRAALCTSFVGLVSSNARFSKFRRRELCLLGPVPFFLTAFQHATVPLAVISPSLLKTIMYRAFARYDPLLENQKAISMPTVLFKKCTVLSFASPDDDLILTLDCLYQKHEWEANCTNVRRGNSHASAGANQPKSIPLQS